MSVETLITDHLDLWTGAITKKSNRGRGSNGKIELTGIKQLRELILELAVRGKLVSQDMPTESSSDLIAVMEKEKARLVNSKRIKRPKSASSVSQENRPFAIHDNWSWHSLGALGYTQTGSTPPKSQSKLFGSDIPFLKPGDISESGEICYSNEGLSEAGKEVLGKWAEKESILMVCIGTIGKCGLIEQPCTFNQQINSVTPYVPETSQFLLLCLKSPYFQNEAWEKSSSTTISILNKGKWESIPVPLPPLEEQHRIVQKVDELMALCDRLEQQTSDQIAAHDTLVETLLGTLTQSQNATELSENWTRLAAHFDTLFTTEQSIEMLEKTILQLAVMGRLVEQDARDEPAMEVIKRAHEKKSQLLADKLIKKQKELPDIREPEKPFSIPPHWAFARLDEICTEITSGSTPPKSEFSETSGIPYLKVYNIRSQRVDFDYKPQYVTKNYHQTTLKRSQLLPGDVVMNIVGPPLGKTAIIPDDRPEWNCNQAIVRFRPIDAELNQFIHLYLKAGTFLRTIELIGTAGQDNVSVTKSRSIVIPLPPKAEQHRIVQKADELIALCDQLRERLNQTSETRCQLAETIVENALQ